MQFKTRKTSIALLLAAVLLVLVGCQQEPLSSDANLESITIAGVRPQSLGTPHTEWLEVIHGDIYLADDQLQNAAVSVSISDGAEVWFARGTVGAPPSFDKTATYTFEHDDVVWVEIFSANLDRYQIYAVRIHKRTPLLSSVDLLKDFVVSTMFDAYFGPWTGQLSRSAIDLGTPAASLSAVTTPGELYIGASEFTGTTPLYGAASVTLTLKALPEMVDTDLRMTIASGSAVPNFDTPDLNLQGKSNGDYLYIESKSGQGDHEVLYYKIKLVEKNDSFDLGTVAINGQSVTPGMLGLHSFAGSEFYSFALGDGGYLLGAKVAANNSSVAAIANAAAPVTVTVTPPSTSGIAGIEYASIDVDSRYAAEGRLNYSTSNALGNIPHGSWIALKVKNQVGDTAWYRFQIAKGSADADLTAVTINGAAIGAVPAANNAANGGTFVPYTMPASGPWANVQAGAAVSSGATAAYALAAAPTSNVTAWTNTTGEFASITSGQLVAIRVVSENGLTTKYYKVRLLYGSDAATISDIKINGTSIGTLPAVNTTANGQTIVDYAMGAASPWASVQVEAVVAAGAQVAYASAAAPTTNITNWTNTTGTFTDLGTPVVAIRVISEDNTVTGYYKVRLVP